jgi:hypothetical protein
MYDELLSRPDDSGQFSLRLAMRLAVTLGPDEDLGRTPDGLRRNYPITGGRLRTFSPDGVVMDGEVIGSGADISVLRDDAIAVVDALYRIRMDDGAVIVVHNKGIYDEPAFGPRGRNYLVSRPEFIAPLGTHDWLNRSFFIGTVDDWAGGVLVSVFDVMI